VEFGEMADKFKEEYFNKPPHVNIMFLTIGEPFIT
jgi:hypothetical protein